MAPALGAVVVRIVVLSRSLPVVLLNFYHLSHSFLPLHVLSLLIRILLPLSSILIVSSHIAILSVSIWMLIICLAVSFIWMEQLLVLVSMLPLLGILAGVLIISAWLMGRRGRGGHYWSWHLEWVE